MTTGNKNYAELVLGLYVIYLRHLFILCGLLNYVCLCTYSCVLT
jgi:hypothetical protein